jgi:hypothetical protein
LPVLPFASKCDDTLSSPTRLTPRQNGSCNANTPCIPAPLQSFARRQPTAFFGIAVLAGFGVVHFLKSSAANSESRSTGGGASRSQASDENNGYRDTSPGSRSIPELFSDAVGQLGKLVGNEFELARVELSEKASLGAAADGGSSNADYRRLLRRGGLFHDGNRSGTGFRRIDRTGDALKPTMTLEQVERDKIAAKEMVK